jgi:ppGpp synthetase/RelA/SpoT-type nucleotidyltranferase
LIEIQVRTSLQHLWAEVSEKLSDQFDPAIKYGGGDDKIRQLLMNASAAVADLEQTEKDMASIDQWDVREHLRERMGTTKMKLASSFEELIAALDYFKKQKP